MSDDRARGDVPPPHDDLERFLLAQEGVHGTALRELQRGRKESHWMWFIFPQLDGLGSSEMARRYAIHGLEEARGYAAHPVLGERLRRCARAVLEADGATAEAIMGPIDARKLRSSMTLFHRADPDEPVFRAVLERYYGGEPDPRTEELLR